MPKPVKSLLIVFSILVYAGVLGLSLNQWQRPVGNAVVNGGSSGSRQASRSAETGSGQATTADSGTVAALTPDAEVGSAESMVSVAPGSAAQPSFDIVRVEPSGDTVVVGRSAPGATVELLSNGSVIATTTANVAGEFVLVLEKPLPAGVHDLVLRTSGDDGVSIYSKNNVVVAIPDDPSDAVLVVMNEPDAASEILAKPDEAAGADGETVIATAPSGEAQIAAAQPQVAKFAPTGGPETPAQTAEIAPAAPVTPEPLGVDAVEVEAGKLYAAGTARPGSIIRVYIDGELIGEATATDNGRWLLEAEAKVPAGTLIVRADQLAPGTLNVVARAEVPFTRQLDMAALIPTATGGAPAGVAAQGELPRPNAIIVRRGDNLWTISRRTFGRGIRYTTIYTANKDQIRNPDLIYPGQVFMLPVGDKTWTQ